MSVHELSERHSAVRSSAPDRETAGQTHARGVLRDRLTADFPMIPSARVGELIDEAYARTAAARIQAFRVLLAERDVRAMLRAELRR